jgi:hypothetical protein
MKNNDIEMTKEEIETSIAEQTNEMTIQEIFSELKEMDEISTKIEDLGGRHPNLEMRVNSQLSGIHSDEELETQIGDDSHYWAVRMDSIRNSIRNLDLGNDGIDFTLVKKFHERVVDTFWHRVVPLVFGMEAVKNYKERRDERNKN